MYGSVSAVRPCTSSSSFSIRRWPSAISAFDAPGREFCRVRRSRTNTPLQAFVLLHDPQFVEAARHLAGRMLTEAGPTNRERIVYGFRLCQSRPPTEPELVVLSEMVDKRLAQYRADLQAAKQLVSVGDTPVEGVSKGPSVSWFPPIRSKASQSSPPVALRTSNVSPLFASAQA